MSSAERPDALVGERAADSWGILTIDQLRACGLTADAVEGRAKARHLYRLHTGVYAVGYPSPPLNGRFLAAVLACGQGATLSHYAGSAFWGYVEWDERPIEVTVPGTSARVRPGLRVHRSRTLTHRDRMVREGIPVTSPERTLVDLAGIVSPARLRGAVRRAEALQRISLTRLCESLERAGRRRGVRALRAIIAEGLVPTRSELEDIVLDLFDRGGLARPDVNKPIMIEGRRIYPDFRWPDQRLIVEADGAKWHDGELARRDDAERQALLEARGERVLRVSWTQAVSQATQTLDRVISAGAPSR